MPSHGVGCCAWVGASWQCRSRRHQKSIRSSPPSRRSCGPCAPAERRPRDMDYIVWGALAVLALVFVVTHPRLALSGLLALLGLVVAIFGAAWLMALEMMGGGGG